MAFRSATDVVALVAIETTYATPPTIGAADAVQLIEPSIEIAGEQLQRNIAKPFFGGNPFVLTGKRITLSATIDLIGAATPGNASPFGRLYRICGHSETLTPTTSAVYAPVSTGIASATVDFYWAGERIRMVGVRGTMEMDFSIDNFPRATVTLTGIYAGPTDATPPSGIDWSAFQTPQTIETPNWALSVGAYNAHARQLTINQGGQVSLVSTSESTQVLITARNSTGNLVVVKDANLSTWDPTSLANAHTIQTITCSVTGSPGRNVSLAARAQLGMPSRNSPVEGLAAYGIPLSIIPSGAGGDEYVLTFT
jgi:hypothetical protein